MPQKNKKTHFSFGRYFKQNWRIPLALVAIAMIATMVSAAPHVFDNFQNSFTTVFLITEKNGVFAKSSASTILPEAWQSELEDHWASSAITDAVAEGFIDTSKDTFRPNAEINRAEMAMIVARTITADESAWTPYVAGTFCDVFSSAWFADAVMTIYDAGFVKGYTVSDCTAGINFQPEKNLTRAEAIKVILSAYGDVITVDTESQSPFKDASLHWAQPYLFTAYNLGIVHGYSDGNFKPDASVSRAEFLKMLIAAVDFVDTQNAAVDDAASTDDDTTTDDDADGDDATSAPPAFNNDIPSI